MIAHVSIGARDIARARRFYDAALKPLGYDCLSSDEGSLGYGAEGPDFWVYGTAHPVEPPLEHPSLVHVVFDGIVHLAPPEQLGLAVIGIPSAVPDSPPEEEVLPWDKVGVG